MSTPQCAPPRPRPRLPETWPPLYAVRLASGSRHAAHTLRARPARLPSRHHRTRRRACQRHARRRRARLGGGGRLWRPRRTPGAARPGVPRPLGRRRWRRGGTRRALECNAPTRHSAGAASPGPVGCPGGPDRGPWPLAPGSKGSAAPLGCRCAKRPSAPPVAPLPAAASGRPWRTAAWPQASGLRPLCTAGRASSSHQLAYLLASPLRRVSSSRRSAGQRSRPRRARSACCCRSLAAAARPGGQ